MKKALIVGVLLGVAVSFQTYRLSKEEERHVLTRIEFESYKASQLAYNEAQKQWMAQEIEKKGREGDEKLEEVQAMLDSVISSADGLRSENARLRTARNSTAASQCKAEYERIRVLTDVLGSCSEKYTAMAGAAQRSRVSGVMCENSYEGIRGKASR